MELLAEGRTAEVFAWSPGRVLKLDRPDWNGLGDLEAALLRRLAGSGLPVPRLDDVIEVDGRCGQLLERIDGPLLSAVVADAPDQRATEALVRRFVDLQAQIASTALAGVPDLITMRRDEVARSGLPDDAIARLTADLDALDDGERALCHFDLHPRNVLVDGDRWVVIDWLTAASGPAVADVARTLLLCGGGDPVEQAFGAAVRRRAAPVVDPWVPILAAARLSEGFTGPAAERLRAIALGGSVGP